MVTELLQQGMTAVEEKLESVVASDIQLLEDASLHIVTSGGKRVRPRVVLLAYLAAGGQDLDSVIPMAAAVEMVHTATLVHDDINDHSLTRRGKVTVHARWGRTFALLTGDYLFTKVYELMAPYGVEPNVMIATACTRLVEGETLQAQAAKAGSMDRETYKQIISLKTASLFEASAKLGAWLAGGEPEFVEAMGTYAYNLGLTFQIVDDILDIIGDPEAMGKPVGLDLTQGRGVLSVAQNGAIGDDEGGTAVAELEEPDPVQQMLAGLRSSGAVEIARLQAEETANRARRALDPIPPSPARDELFALIEAVLKRDH
ncbi:MAG: polyprenyl synthetase family protein [Anaerolineales bacterium]|nr:polyprenyl synthetase family protein [Anaerolineales bacterium]MCB8986195.1 polyprenyl synthetase family protein [Ardenticatenaceae bacterium]